jgi:hypothetical protein
MTQDTSPSQRKRSWPDMSAYGLFFGVLDMPNGEPRMVMVDRDGAWAALAKRMGFSQSRWFGLYVKSSLKLDIPGFKTSFPSAKVEQLTDQEIRDRVRPLILERRNQRLSQMQAGPGAGRLSWHPRRTVVAEAAKVVAAPAPVEEAAGALSPEAALRQTLFLGMNSLGQEVFESGDGLRFVRSGEAIVARETPDATPSSTFLRSSNDEDLVAVAAGMVREIDAGKRLHSDDFIRFMEATFGSGSSEDKEMVGRFHRALDRAMLERVAMVEGAGHDTFAAALRLHEGRPPFWRASGSWSTPLPIAVVMQSLAASRIQAMDAGVAPSVIDITSHPKSHSWSLAATSVSGGDIPAHDVALAGVFGQVSAGQSVGGVRITRSDTEALLASLAKRNADGLTVFVVTTDKAGRLDNEFRRALSAIGQRYEVAGLVDLDATLVGPGNEQSSRLVVIGRKRAEPDYAFAVPGDVPVIYDYAGLWGWGETLRAAHLGESETFGDDGREENRWQAPYIPASQISEPQAMSPRNLLGPVRMALARIVERNGLGIDGFICSKLGWTMEQLEARLDAEQADALAIGIQALDDGMAMVEADATGLGKGRVAAALAVYGKKAGMPVVFMTEKSDLFADFYRDVNDIGCLEELGNPFIVNNDLIVRDTSTGAEIARSPKREVAQMTLACGDFPVNNDMVLATYSQFNRKYEAKNAERNVGIARVVRSLIRGEVEPFAALSQLAPVIGMSDYATLNIVDASAAIAYEQAKALAARAIGQIGEAEAHEASAALLAMSREEMLPKLSEHIKSDMTTLKHQWLYSGALNNALLILDESHVAAGADSQTGVNLRHIVENAGALAYSSATFAKDTGNFLLYSRLFPSSLRAATIGETLNRGGETMQEIISGMLAMDGRLVRREHDLSNLEFKVSVDDSRQARNEVWANGFAQVLAAMSYLSGEVQDIVTTMNEATAAAIKGAKDKKAAAGMKTVGVQYTNFASKFYALSRAFMMALNADLSSDLAIKALREGRKPVITVENTMESVLRELVEGVDLGDTTTDAADAAAQALAAAQASAASVLASADPLAALEAAAGSQADLLAAADARAAELDKKSRSKPAEEIQLGRSVSFKDILTAYVDSMFAANEQTRKGNKLLSSKRISLANPELEEAAQKIRELISVMPEVPLSPMDLVRERITAAGYTVDEISGRRLTLKTNPDGTHKVVRMSERKKQPLKKAFNDGTLDALILSKSGSTGISLHASRTFADQSQRELIELQVAADIAQRLQFWGRVNRKGQVCSPIIHMVGSGLPAEMRLITMQNAKLRRMSANISGNADNSALNDDAPDILNRIGNEVCYRWMESNPKVSSILGYQFGEIPEEQARFSGTKFVDMLTGRMMMLDVDTQRRVYREITAEFRALIEQYELEGTNPLKSAAYDLRAKRTGNLVLQVATGRDSVFSEAVKAVELTYPIQLPAIVRSDVETAAELGRAALVEQYGADYAGILARACLQACDAALPAMLPKRLATVEEALNEVKTNAVKNAANKFNWLAEALPRAMPGSVVSFADSERVSTGKNRFQDDGFTESIYITGWKTPATNMLSMAEYKLVGYSLRSRKKVELSMSSLYTRPASWIDASWGRDKEKDYKRETDAFFDATALPVSGEEKRIVLEGNLYRAAEIAEGQKQGTTITYTDDRGVWHHAVLMPKTYTLRNVADMPVTIDNVETLVAAFMDRNSKDRAMLAVSDDMREGVDSRTYRLYGNSTSLILWVSGSAEKAGWLLNADPLKQCLKNGDFQGSRGNREGRVLPGHEQQFLEAFMAAANTAGAKVMMDGSMREWYNNYLAAKLEPALNQNAVDAALASTEDDELSALLATP